MAVLQWSESLSLELPVMDETHQEFVALLARVETADDATLVAAWRALVDHTAEHFGREDDWMRRTGFTSTNCHTVQHRVVLEVMCEGLVQGLKGQNEAIRQMARELAVWFVQHAQTMDAALALHLRSVGFDAGSGEVRMPQALPAEPVQGCGTVACATVRA
ncbi:bacteriohemerythrin [Variovorax sp. ZT4R33]|uniref:bacteriohemerythrin n=1 Tax=Variovorax sp. ZT4R33 TaxID=3443743 RepID=UPI003F459427